MDRTICIHMIHAGVGVDLVDRKWWGEVDTKELRGDGGVGKDKAFRRGVRKGEEEGLSTTVLAEVLSPHIEGLPSHHMFCA